MHCHGMNHRLGASATHPIEPRCGALAVLRIRAMPLGIAVVRALPSRRIAARSGASNCGFQGHWFVTRGLGCGAYLRYVDDFVLFADDKRSLGRMRRQVIERMALDRLVIHEAQAQVVPTAQGIPWLGFVVYPTHRLLKRRKAVNFTRALRQGLCEYRAGQISFAELDASVQGWINPVRYADTWGLREHIFRPHPIKG